MKILIVDDSKIVLSMHSRMLSDAGFDVRTALNGAEALEHLMVDKFDAMLTDLNMPRMNGYELVQKVRALESGQLMPIIMISTEKEKNDEQQGLSRGVDLYIIKPVEADQLVASIRMLLPGAA